LHAREPFAEPLNTQRILLRFPVDARDAHASIGDRRGYGGEPRDTAPFIRVREAPGRAHFAAAEEHSVRIGEEGAARIFRQRGEIAAVDVATAVPECELRVVAGLPGLAQVLRYRARPREGQATVEIVGNRTIGLAIEHVRDA